MNPPALEIADLIRTAGAAFVERKRQWIRWKRVKVLLAIARCRTAALGGHFDECTRCAHRLPARGLHTPLPPAPSGAAKQKVIYGLLFRASAETLLEVARDPRHLGAEIGFFSVLCAAPWNQKVRLRPHVHCVEPAVVLLTVPSGARQSYAPVHCSLPEDPVRETPHTPEECLSKAQFFQKVGQILHP